MFVSQSLVHKLLFFFSKNKVQVIADYSEFSYQEIYRIS